MGIMRWLAGAWLAAAAVMAAAPAAHAAASGWVGDARAQARLVTAGDGVTGATLRAGLEFRFPHGWHGYWRTPGDAGVAPHLDWSRSADVAAADLAWPAPTRLVVDGLQNAVYTGDVVLPLTLRLREAHAPAQLRLALDYATCSNVCVPEHADLALDLPAAGGASAAPSAQAASLDAAALALPRPPAQAGFSIVSATLAAPSTNRSGAPHLQVRVRSTAGPFAAPDLFVEGAGSGLPAAPEVRLSDDRREARFDVVLPAAAGTARALGVTLVDGGRAASFEVDRARAGAAVRDEAGWLSILLLALAGGLILNLMPCVLPVLSLKAFALVRTAGASRAATRRLAAASALGTVASFLLLALGLATLKLGGGAIGWGIQFQQPWFLATMSVATALFAASLFDWLPLGLPAVLADLAGAPATRGPLVEAFLSGAFATLLATPCSAPLVGTAVGFALARGPLDIVAVLLAMGIGMSSPFWIIAIAPSLAGWLPRPGAWMNRLRTGLGFLLLATTGWLLVLLSAITGARIALAVALLLAALVGLRAIVSGLAPAAPRRWPRVLLVGLAAGAIAVAGLPDARRAPDAAGAGRAAGADVPAERAGWQRFDPQRVATLVAAGETVFVDVDATWCLTCKVNELTVLSQPAVRRALAASHVVRMRADWSHVDPDIARYVTRFGRAGIPLDVVYGPSLPDGLALPELLRADTVVEAIDRAGA
ncbi:protein-disulfide reductase DsbD family protein [Burkholderia plantarii]|uniref:protein-disulfide reductase DsbD family protein n=1 Tax=Burkholderia plantarii TaxID=41899 RepID=UPI0018DC9E5E|nr:protein-disulfide reductase DsbD domain-containing protein [Burkholderia plantarii]MBI0329294.1 thioredoxin family protein [Burkholderia plantarii]